MGRFECGWGNILPDTWLITGVRRARVALSCGGVGDGTFRWSEVYVEAGDELSGGGRGSAAPFCFANRSADIYCGLVRRLAGAEQYCRRVAEKSRLLTIGPLDKFLEFVSRKRIVIASVAGNPRQLCAVFTVARNCLRSASHHSGAGVQ